MITFARQGRNEKFKESSFNTLMMLKGRWFAPPLESSLGPHLSLVTIFSEIFGWFTLGMKGCVLSFTMVCSSSLVENVQGLYNCMLLLSITCNFCSYQGRLFFFFKYLFILRKRESERQAEREREREREKQAGRERERERNLSRLHAISTLCGAWAHEPKPSQTLDQLSHPGAPKIDSSKGVDVGKY